MLSMMRGMLAGVLVLVATGSIARAAEDPHLLLRRGIQLHREAAYAASVAALEQARRSSSMGTVEQVECGFYLAADYVALNSMQAARRELRAVLEADPSYELPPFTSPKVTALFHDVEEELEKLPRLRALPPRRLSNATIELWFEPSRTGGTAWGGVRWRFRGDRGWRETPLAHVGEQLLATVEIDRNGTLEYYAEARGPQGLAQAASEQRPLELPVTGYHAPGQEREKKPLAKAWWLWTSVGAVALAGAGVGLYFALRPSSSATGDAVLAFKVQ
jgi:hypothetical protein